MSNDKLGCGSWTTIGHGENAICGKEFYGEIYICDGCKNENTKTSLTEIIRLKDEENKQLLNDKTELIEFIKDINMDCIYSYGHGVGKIIERDKVKRVCEIIGGENDTK